MLPWRRNNRASLTLAILLGLLLACAPGDACITRSGHEGVCKNIKYCRSIMRKLMIHPSRRVLAELRQFNCGFDGMEPMVCCEKSSNSQEISSSTTTMTSTTTTTTTMTTPRPRPVYEEPSRQIPERHASSMTATGQSKAAAEETGEGPDPSLVHPNARLLDHELCGRSPALAKIYGGSETRLFEFPWMALLKYNDSSSRNSSQADPEPFKCAGTIISRKFVLTAAHCVAQLPNLKLAGVRIGEHDLSTEIDCESYGNDSALICAKKHRDLDVEWSLVHPDYSQLTWQNDIALVRVRGAMSFKPANVRPICLPLGASSRALEPATAVVTGWGSSEASYPSTTARLRKVGLPIVPTDECRKAYSDQPFMEISRERQLCAGGQEGRDSCSGDSGGPLQASGPYNGAAEYRTVQYGIVSYGRQRCAVPGVPGVYTRLRPYVPWILDNMSE